MYVGTIGLCMTHNTAVVDNLVELKIIDNYYTLSLLLIKHAQIYCS